MNTVFAVQIFIILSFLFSLRMRVWRTSLNSFIFICGLFILTISREFEELRDVWTNYHVSVMGITLFLVMSRVAYQSFSKKYKEMLCSGCTNYNRRAADKK
jgi:hypothetical protein